MVSTRSKRQAFGIQTFRHYSRKIREQRTSLTRRVLRLQRAQRQARGPELSLEAALVGWRESARLLYQVSVPFIAAGPIMAALAGAGVGGAVGGLTGALVGMGIPEYEAVRYEGRVKEGGILLSVHSDNSEWTKRAKEILERTGAQHISSTGEKSADFAKTDKPLPRAS